MMMSSSKRSHLLVIPFPGQGHLLPLLDLVHHLTVHFAISSTIVTTPSNLPILAPLLALHPSSLLSPLVLPSPSPLQNTKDLHPSQFRTFILSLSQLSGPIADWWTKTPNPPTAVLSDMFCGWAYSLALRFHVPRIVFSPSNALSIASVHDLWRRLPSKDNDGLVASPSLPDSPSFRWHEISGMYRSYVAGDESSETLRRWFLDNARSWGYVLNTSWEIEGAYIEHLRRDLGHGRIWAVGPLAPPAELVAERGGTTHVSAEAVTGWLDGCRAGSVVYVAFGTHVVLSAEVAAVLAAALEESGARFVWALRDPTVLPRGFVDRTAGRGLVIEGWAPQVAILGHVAVGAFVSHGGWNSVLEAVSAGVVLLMWPMGADQFYNARLVVDELGLGFRVRDGGPSDPLPDPSQMGRVVEFVTGDSGKEVRARAVEMSRKVRAAMEVKEGSSYRDLEGFVRELSCVSDCSENDKVSENGR